MFTLCLALLTGGALAAQAEAAPQRVIVGGVELDDSGGSAYARTDGTGAVTMQGAGENNWNVKLADGVLTLNNAVITQGYSYEDSCAGIYAEGGLDLVLMGENTIGGDGMNEGVHVLAGLVIRGDGSLDVAVGGSASCCGIYAGEELMVAGGAVNVSAAATGEGSSCGIHNGEYDLTISGGSVTITSIAQNGESYGIYNEYETYLTGGSLTAAAFSDNGDSLGVSCAYNLIVLGCEGNLSAQGGTQAIQGDITFFVNEFIYDISGKHTVQFENGRVTADGAELSSRGVEELWVNGVQLVGGDEPGQVDGVSYDPATSTLTLDGAVITEGYAYASDYTAGIWTAGNLNLKLVGHNTVTGTMNEGVSVTGNLNISGDGSLEVSINPDDTGSALYCGYLAMESGTLHLTSASKNDWSNGILLEFSMRMDGGTITASAEGMSYNGGVYVFDELVVNGGTLTATANSNQDVICDGIYVVGDMTVNGGTVTGRSNIENGIRCRSSLTVNGGTVTAEGGLCGLFMPLPFGPERLSVSGGSLNAYSDTGYGLAVNRGDLTLDIGAEGVLCLMADYPISAVGEGSSHTVTNQGSLIVRVDDVEKAQRYLAYGGKVTLVLGGDLEGDLSIPAGIELLIDGDGQYAIHGALACQGEDGKATTLTLKDLSLDGGDAKEHAVSSETGGAGGLDLTLEGCTVSGYTGRAIYLDNGTALRLDGCTFRGNAANEAGGDGSYPVDLYLADMDAGALTIVNSSFNGVAEGDWFYDAMCYAWDKGLMAYSGSSESAPGSPFSRAMLVTVLWRLAEQPAASLALEFDDVAGNAWYAQAVGWAAGEQILECGTGSFGPETPVTREEMAVLLYRYAQARGDDVSIGEDTNILSYTDAFDVSEGAMAAMQWACGAGIIRGAGDGSLLNPQTEATRAEAAAMLLRFCQGTAA